MLNTGSSRRSQRVRRQWLRRAALLKSWYKRHGPSRTRLLLVVLTVSLTLLTASSLLRRTSARPPLVFETSLDPIRVDIRKAPSVSPNVINLADLDTPLVCDHVLLNTEHQTVLTRHQSEWLPSNDCHLAVSVSSDTPRATAIGALTRMARNGFLKKPQDTEAPWVMWMSANAVPMEKNSSIQTLIERVSKVCERDTAEACEGCVAPTLQEIAVIVPMNCVTPPTGDSVILLTPSRAAALTVHLGVDTLYDLDTRVVQDYCVGNDTGDKLVMARRLDINKAMNDPVSAYATQLWFPDGRLWPGEPSHLAVVDSRWMSSDACVDTWRCGDMVADFTHCPDTGYWAQSFRQHVCVDTLPFNTSDDGLSPFNATQWVAQGVASTEPLVVKHFRKGY
eukprot:Blabericola_migrator_1__8044@NODE_412_length_8716_cov_285_566539_g325_i0_p4_GENE_NODE_412_length_8716_cov_285_566539_g325_i0NODE_412_length_8716_cov_285_566539_g325_i0_p4_ORF_typecomplete_len393_score86_58Glyco_transf_34/PF05637_12/2_1Glyco_transf_34/PF05637_12/2_3e02_NODE_412_length_8716_cov_285_566539_g325_i048606038